MDKQMIEEMAKHLHSTHAVSAMCAGKDCNHCKHADLKRFEEYTCIDLDLAESLYNEGYRKIEENAVVLARGDYEKLLDVRADVILKDIDKVFKEEFEDTKRSMERKIKPIYKAIETRTRKETAEKFAERLKDYLCDKSILEFGSDDSYIITASLDECYGKIDEICKEFTEGKV